MSEDIYDVVLTLLEKRGTVPGDSEQDKLNYRYLDAGHVDSLGLHQFILEIEDQFGFTLSSDESQSDDFRTLGGLIRIIEAHL